MKNKILKKKKYKTWRLIYPDGTESLMSYDPIEFVKQDIKKFEEKESKIKELHKLVVSGLVNGLSHTHRDGRLNNIDFWRKRCFLFREFSKCVLDIMTDQDYKYSEKDLKEIAKGGYN